VRGILSAPVQRFSGGSRSSEQDFVAVEEPLQIRIGERNVSITMRTPGNDAELAVGFLFTEGILRGAGDVARIDCAENQTAVTLAAGVEIDAERLQRNFYMTSSCGVCGKASIEALESADVPRCRVESHKSPNARSVPFPTRSARRRPCSSAPAGCTRQPSFLPKANCSRCAKTLAATTPWTS